MICVSLPRAPQYSSFACCLIPVLTLVVLLVMLDDIDDISFSKRRYFLIVSGMSISVYCIPTRDTHITRDMCMGIHISRGYTYHCDTGNNTRPGPAQPPPPTHLHSCLFYLFELTLCSIRSNEGYPLILGNKIDENST